MLRPLFKDVFRQLQRGKALESYVFSEGCYLLSLDGTGYFSSRQIHCSSCMQKTSKNGEVTYDHQMLWERLRSFFREHLVTSMREILEALYYGYQRQRPVLTANTS